MSVINSIVSNLRRPLSQRAKPGARPGTVVADPTAPKPRIRVIAYNDKEIEEVEIEDVKDVEPYLEDDRIAWVNVDGLGDIKVIKRLAEMFDLHPLVVEDIVHVHQRAKVEEFPKHLYIVVRMLTDAESSTEQVSMIVGDGFVLTFQERVGDCFEPIRERLRYVRGRIRTLKSDYLAYALIDAVLDAYFPVLERYAESLEILEEELLERPLPGLVARIHRLRSSLYVLRKAIAPHREAVNTLLRDSTPFVTANTQVFLRDCYDHVIQLSDMVETSREMCADLRDFHFTQVSMRQNDIMKVLTIMATIFIPLGFVAGVYGMNFDSDQSPYNMPELKWFYGYPFALGLMATMAMALVGYFWYRGWLGREPTWKRKTFSDGE